MFELSKTFTFDAGHVLEHHEGLCRNPHGHTYTLILTLRSPMLQEEGPSKNMVVDFHDVTNVVKPMLKKYFDHQWLNDTLETDSPTVEFMVKWMFDFLKPQLPELFKITLFETPTSSASYFEA